MRFSSSFQTFLRVLNNFKSFKTSTKSLRFTSIFVYTLVYMNKFATTSWCFNIEAKVLGRELGNLWWKSPKNWNAFHWISMDAQRKMINRAVQKSWSVNRAIC